VVYIRLVPSEYQKKELPTMTKCTKYLKSNLESFYDTDYLSTMDDLIRADNRAERVLNTHYSNADYTFLKQYASILKTAAYTEVLEH
jgi:hypothetical protein